MMDMLNEKDAPSQENQTTPGKLFEAIMLHEQISEQNVRGVTACFNARYMPPPYAIGEDIQHDFGFLFLEANEKKRLLPKVTAIVGREVLAVEGFKPDHMQRLAVLRRMAGIGSPSATPKE